MKDMLGAMAALQEQDRWCTCPAAIANAQLPLPMPPTAAAPPQMRTDWQYFQCRASQFQPVEMAAAGLK